MLELINVSKSYQSPTAGQSVFVLNGINLRIENGKSAAVVGPSGSGKSTLLNIIGALDRPDSGKVLLDGVDLCGLGDVELAKIRNKHIGFVFQLHHLLPQCTVLENVLIPTIASGKQNTKEDFEDRAVRLLERVGLKDFLLHRPGQLSGGQRQRVAVVRALINKPKLLLADEPTGSLDAKAAQTVAEVLIELNQSEKVTLILATHSLKLAELTERLLTLDNGTITERQTS